jgi:hypothetical protein
MKESAHWCHEYFHRAFADPASGLMAVITGLRADPDSGRPHLSSIDEHFRRRMDYLQAQQFLTVRFEDIVGAAGGGDDQGQREAISRVADHLGLRLSQRDLNYITANAFSQQSPTFRKGQIGSWRAEMSSEQRTAFQAIAGSLLVELGYESGAGW